MTLHRLRERGDTIIEVLFAIAVMSAVLTAAYVTTNRNYLIMRDAQEHTDALKLLERQTESLRTYNDYGDPEHQNLASQTDPFCMTITHSDLPDSAVVLASGASCVLDTTGTPAASGTEPAYTIKIVNKSTLGNGVVFTLTAVWDNVTGTGQDQAQIEYGVY